MRLIGVFVACAAFALPLSASAATYDVTACGGTGINHSWAASSSQPDYLSVASACPASATYSGVAAYDNLNAPGYAPSGSTASWQFAAPSGTKINEFRYSRYLGKYSD